MSNDPQALVENALNTKTFSVLDAIKGRSYPTDQVTIYPDPAPLYLLQKYENDRLELDIKANNARTGEEANEWDAKIEALDTKIKPLREEIEVSAIVFEMRGFAPQVRDSLIKEAKSKFDLADTDNILDGTAADAWLNARVVAESIIRTRASDGSVDEHLFTVEEVEEYRKFLPPEEFGKLIGMALMLSYTAFAYDASVTPDFS